MSHTYDELITGKLRTQLYAITQTCVIQNNLHYQSNLNFWMTIGHILNIIMPTARNGLVSFSVFNHCMGKKAK